MREVEFHILRAFEVISEQFKSITKIKVPFQMLKSSQISSSATGDGFPLHFKKHH